MAITYAGGKAIHLGWKGIIKPSINAVSQGFKNIGNEIANVLYPSRQVAGVGGIETTPLLEHIFSSQNLERLDLQNKPDVLFKQHNNNINNSNRYNNRGGNNNIGNTEPKVRIQNTREDVLNFFKTIKEKYGDILDGWKSCGGGHFATKVNKDFEYNGIKFEKGYYFGRDDMHNEIELFKNKNTHLGAIDPKTGKIYKDPVEGRKLNI